MEQEKKYEDDGCTGKALGRHRQQTGVRKKCVDDRVSRLAHTQHECSMSLSFNGQKPLHKYKDTAQKNTAAQVKEGQTVPMASGMDGEPGVEWSGEYHRRKKKINKEKKSAHCFLSRS